MHALWATRRAGIWQPVNIDAARREGWERDEPEAIAAYLFDARSKADRLFADIGKLL